MYTVFANPIGKDMSFERLENINKTAVNQEMILKEMMEMGKGDYEIQSDIGLVKEIPEDVAGSLDELEVESKGLPSTKSILTGTDLSEDVKSYDDQIKVLAAEIEGQYEDIRNTDDQVRIINAKRDFNIVLLQKEEDFLNTSPQLKSLAEAEIKNLNSKISDLKEEQSKYSRAQFRLEPIPGMEMRESGELITLGVPGRML